MAGYTWDSTGAAGVLGLPVKLYFQPFQASVMYEHSTGCTGTVAFRTAMESTGPWATLGSTTTNSSAAEAFFYTLTGPFGEWIQPTFTGSPTTGYHRVKINFPDDDL
jgi:hypothetical protein